MHVGDGEWVILDSCINPETRRPAALSYLENDLGLDAATVVKLVVITHWDDDHIRGITEIVEACADAAVSCSLALRNKEFLAFVMEQESAAGTIGSGLDELRTVLRLCASSGRQIRWALANQPLHPLPPGSEPRVTALSPSANAVERSITALVVEHTGRTRTVARRFRAPEGPNGASVVTWIRNAEVGAVLGADLEGGANPDSGWNAVLRDAAPPFKSLAVKVPHHGSEGAHHDGIWSELLAEDPLAIVTPWTKGGNNLPLDSDLERLVKLAGTLYMAAEPRIVRAKHDSSVESVIRKVHGRAVSELRGWGHVQARRSSGDGAWRVELDGDAYAVAA